MNRVSEKEVIEEIKSVSQSIGAKVVTQKQFFSKSKITISDVLQYFPKWPDACKAAGVDYDRSRDKIPEEDLLKDWGRVARMIRDTPTLNVYIDFYARQPYLGELKLSVPNSLVTRKSSSESQESERGQQQYYSNEQEC